MTLVIQPPLTVSKKLSGGLGGISSVFKVQQCVEDQQPVWEQEVRCETFTDSAAGFLSAAAFVKSCLGKLEQYRLFPSCGSFLDGFDFHKSRISYFGRFHKAACSLRVQR